MSQTIDLTTPFSIPNATKLEISRPLFDDDSGECSFSVTLRTNNVTAAKICSWCMIIKDGTSDKVARQASPTVGLNVEDRDRWVILTTRTTATGYTDLVNAWKTGNNSNNRQSAFKALLLSAGHIDSTLTGT